MRSLGRGCLTGGSGSNCGAPGRRARLVRGGGGDGVPWRQSRKLERAADRFQGRHTEQREGSVCDAPARGALGPRTQILFPPLGVCVTFGADSLAPIARGSPGNPRPRNVQSQSLNLWVPPPGHAHGALDHAHKHQTTPRSHDHAHPTGIRSGHGDTQHPRGGLLVAAGSGMRRRGPASRGRAASGAPRGSPRGQGARGLSGASKLPGSWAAGRGRGRSGRR